MRSIANETCDRCGPAIRAMVFITNIPMFNERNGFQMGDLTLCGHDYDLHAAVMAQRGYTVHDYRYQLRGQAA